MADTGTVYVLDRYQAAQRHLRPWLQQLSVPQRVVEEFDLDWQPPDDAALVVSVQHFRAPEVSILRRITAENRVPVLIQADGILEYRNTWERPDQSPANIYQPLLGHKLACIGRSQARVLEAWGNHGKCEVVGIPRLDVSSPPDGRRPAHPGNSWRVLVATAKCPAFTPQQRRLVLASLVDLKEWFDRHREIDSRPVDVVWRLTDGLEKEIGLPARSINSLQTDLSASLAEVDAVVTTPSTLMLEAMRCGLPTAILDYTNSPAYVPAAWSITAPGHRDAILPELARPPESKRHLQEMLLHEALECRGSASSRLACLAEAMIQAGRECRARSEPLQLPPRILAVDGEPIAIPAVPSLFPDWDRAALQAEIGHLQVLVRQQAATIEAHRAREANALHRRVLRRFINAFGQNGP